MSAKSTSSFCQKLIWQKNSSGSYKQFCQNNSYCLVVNVSFLYLIDLKCLAILQLIVYNCYYKSKKAGKDQETIQSSTTPNPGYHIGNLFWYNAVYIKGFFHLI